MQTYQREHIDRVMQTVAGGSAGTPDAAGDSLIHDSWRRCARDYRLDPTRMQDAIILPSHRLREHQDRMDEFLQIARSGMQALYQHVAGLGYVVLLTDARGVTVDFLGDLNSDHSLRRAGLYLGSDWSEPLAGTCGVGTCISTGQALTVHQGDHFDATHIPLTCTTAPVFDGRGQLNAVLDISALRSPQSKESQHMALQMVQIYAHHIENASFLRQFRHDWVLRLSPSPQFLEVNPDYLLALDAAGRVIGHNRRAQLLLQDCVAGPLIGAAFERLFNARLGDLGRFLHSCPADRRAITLAGSSQLLFLLASPAPAAARPAPSAAVEPVPAPLAALCGGDAALARQIARAARFVNSPIGLLLTGETGSGKEFFAKALHASGERRGRPFVAVNCAAIPEALAESELFGYLPGSFSGAGSRAKRGLVQEADGGTLFLDEIGDMTLALQARLLRVLAEREVLPVGATRPVPVNIRVMAATHCDLEALVREGRFRADLYYRLNGAHLVLPPLRERTDLGWLIARMLANPRDGSDTAPLALSLDARARLLAHRWPGNLRELHNVIEYARSLCSHGVIELDDLPDHLAAAPRLPASASAEPAAPAPALASEAAQLLQHLSATHWNVAEAARRMGLSRMTLYRRMQRWGIASPNQRDGGAAG
ncbi:sigma-54-dependent Fis family transcriptional regulator [Polaromonas naphthalenivorans]|uniref:GAF modulated sigma54 specific transcriptional regulator, Fis family n=1 Tax=Polaromonas naphthalenivorans (strain CJ2) TaxID=365044 RepID=A1VJW1_POLNA|nr:sigma-54-dependent Fis family transcriptional regulator [Polaromonas naphthalenivorans]ABM35939.1 GAF modulated sigma54 specific transcriptional regulator, Fis family [Polaromonas naphthalenivorans CJ2]